ncbi:MAG TPA: hypothetical protein VGP68_00535 [Gemmataceae bacterium]|jgi:hypothetical protein|nr:hypothetical protein [Gemmataceae bacterium]
MVCATRLIPCLIALPFLAAVCFGSHDNPSTSAFAPVAPPQALGHVLKLNFDQVERWCDENDLASAAQASQSALVLATFLAHHAADKAKPHAEKLLADCKAVDSATRAKNMPNTRAQLTAANTVLPTLLQSLSADKPSWTDFKPSGSTRAWMLLLDGGYADAKSAEKADDFEAIALTLAEEANVVAFLKNEPRWRQMAFAVREVALAAAKESQQNPTKARQTLRTIYPRCESCHRAYQR